MIECRNINFHYNNKKSGFQIKDISLKIERGYFTCLLGHNGAGKTTLLKLFYGMLMPDSGAVEFDEGNAAFEEEYGGKEKSGTDISDNYNKVSAAASAISQDNIIRCGMEPQKYVNSSQNEREKLSLKNIDKYHQMCAYVGEEWSIPFLSVKDNVDTLSVLYPEFDWKLYGSLLKKLDFNEPDTVYFRLSTGQQMKVQICFQLARRPKYIILDEPLANLDVVAKRDIIEALQQGIKEWDMGVILSTHLLDEISDVVDYIAVMENGRLCEYGERDEMFAKHVTDSLRDVMHSEDGKE